MEPSFWLERWREGRIGFHEGQPNSLLERHGPRLGNGARVLVPLCGKSEDMMWLASRGHRVVGVELAEAAVRAFFDEHGLIPQEVEAGGLRRFEAGPITLWLGDFFACTPELLGPLDAFYDRAALVALPPAMRSAYVAHLRRLAAPIATGLVITFEYPQHLAEGPPFAVLEPELRALYQAARVDLLEERAEARGGRLEDQVGRILERCYVVTLGQDAS
jgi:thiopurine S-methyltransferase